MTSNAQGVGMTQSSDNFKVTNEGDYIRLETWGELHENNLDAPANAALALNKETGIDKLLDNISKVDPKTATVTIQAKGFGVVWKLRAFKKVAIVFNGEEMGYIFLSSLQAMHLSGNRFKGFEHEAEAIAWLREEE